MGYNYFLVQIRSATSFRVKIWSRENPCKVNIILIFSPNFSEDHYQYHHEDMPTARISWLSLLLLVSISHRFLKSSR